MARVFLLNPQGPRRRGFTREGRCTQAAGVWGTPWPPLTLATAAAFLLREGHEVRVWDGAVSCPGRPFIEPELEAFHPDLVVWSTGTPTLGHDLSLGREIKRLLPGAFTAVLGTHVTARPQDALRRPGVDGVIRGEPEGTLAALASALPDAPASVPGTSIRSRSGRDVIHNPAGPLLDPADIPAPAWHLLDPLAYRLPLKGRPFLLVAPARGCPYACSFCTAPAYYGRRLRKRPVAQVLDEIEGNVVEHNVRDLLVWADTFTAERSYVVDLCDGLLRRRLDVAWTCNSRVDTVDRVLLSRMRAAGCWMVSFGLESASPDVLDRCGKGIRPEQMERAVHTAREAGLRTSGHFMLGLPGETPVTMAATLAMALRLPLDTAQFYAASPFPGTRLHDEAFRKGWLSGANGFSQARAVMELPGLSAGEVNAFRRTAYRRFYGRARTLRNLAAMLEPRAVLSAGANLRGVIQWMKGTP